MINGNFPALHRVEFSVKLESMRIDLVPKMSKSHYFWAIPHDFGVLGYTRMKKDGGKWVRLFLIFTLFG